MVEVDLGVSHNERKSGDRRASAAVGGGQAQLSGLPCLAVQAAHRPPSSNLHARYHLRRLGAELQRVGTGWGEVGGRDSCDPDLGSRWLTYQLVDVTNYALWPYARAESAQGEGDLMAL